MYLLPTMFALYLKVITLQSTTGNIIQFLKGPFRTQMSLCVTWKPEVTQFKFTERQQPVVAIKLEQRFVWLPDLKGRIICAHYKEIFFIIL